MWQTSQVTLARSPLSPSQRMVRKIQILPKLEHFLIFTRYSCKVTTLRLQLMTRSNSTPRFSLHLLRRNLLLRSSCCCWVETLQVDLLVKEVEAKQGPQRELLLAFFYEHASEASALMSRHSPGTPSPADPGYGSLNHERTTRSSSPQPTTSSSPSPTSLPSSMARLTMVDVSAWWDGCLMSQMYMPQYYPRHPPKWSDVGPHQQTLETGTAQPPRSSTAGLNASYSTKIFLERGALGHLGADPVPGLYFVYMVNSELHLDSATF